MRRKLATLLAVAAAALALASPSFGDGGWGAGGACADDVCFPVEP
jgi:hypothetical protein